MNLRSEQPFYRSDHPPRQLPEALGNMVTARVDLSEIRRAITYYEQAPGIACEIGDRCSEGLALVGVVLARVAWMTSTPHSLWQEAVGIYEKIEDPGAQLVRRWLPGSVVFTKHQ